MDSFPGTTGMNGIIPRKRADTRAFDGFLPRTFMGVPELDLRKLRAMLNNP